MSNGLPPCPPDFGIRYVFWMLWCNSITILMIIQGIFATITLDPTLVPHNVFHYILLGNAILCAIVAQVKKNNPPPAPPTKAATASTPCNPPDSDVEIK